MSAAAAIVAPVRVGQASPGAAARRLALQRPAAVRHVGRVQQPYQQQLPRGAARAAGGGREPAATEGQLQEQLLQLTTKLAATPVYRVAEVGVLLAMLAVLDAGYSGDWSRIGVITEETEEVLADVAAVLWGLHGVCAAAAAKIASDKNRSLPAATAKGLMFGTLGVMREVIAEAEEPAGGAAKRQ